MEVKKRHILYAMIAALVVFAAFVVFQKTRVNEIVTEPPLISEEKDLGALKVTGELPGYDVDRDGEADYLKLGLFPYVDAYKRGGFNYSGGRIEILETNKTIILPPMYFFPSDMTETSVGGYVIFEASGKMQDAQIDVSVRVSAFGRQVNSYVVSIAYPGKDPYILRDIADGKTPGTFEKEEITGPGMIRL